jgi:hypothetical protein
LLSRVFGKRVLSKIFRPKKEEVTGGWEKLRNEEVHQHYWDVQIKESEVV